MKAWLAACLVLLTGSAFAQHHQDGHKPYSGLHSRTVKALSEQQLSDLRKGKGLGFALAAELNGYPGPMHALELADGLGLSNRQRSALHEMVDAMKREAIAAGELFIDSERALDQQFATREITPQRLLALTAEVGERQAALRAVHLKYHLSTAKLLTAEQRERYAELRGYK